MPFLLRNLTLRPGQDEGRLQKLAADQVGLDPSALLCFQIMRKGVDARKKPKIVVVYTVSFRLDDESVLGRQLAHVANLEYVSEEPPVVFSKRHRTDPVLIVLRPASGGLWHSGNCF